MPVSILYLLGLGVEGELESQEDFKSSEKSCVRLRRGELAEISIRGSSKLLINGLSKSQKTFSHLSKKSQFWAFISRENLTGEHLLKLEKTQEVLPCSRDEAHFR